MAISADGWFEWAERVPGHPRKTNPGVNPVRGVVAHSAEGYEAYLRADPPKPTGVSWHLTNLFDGHLLQMYPLTAKCWHATALNNEYIGIEQEGTVDNEPTLTDGQVETLQRVIAEISARYAWTPSRPSSPTDVSHTCWEHNEVVRLGGSATACPSGRIPWDRILAGGGTPPVGAMTRHNWLASFWNSQTVLPSGGELVPSQPCNARYDLHLPVEAKLVRLDIMVEVGRLQLFDGSGAFAGEAAAGRRSTVDVFLNAEGFILFGGRDGCRTTSIGSLGFWS